MEKNTDAFVPLSDSDRQALERLCSYEAQTWGAALRAMIVLKSGLGEPVEAISQELGVSVRTVHRWRRRYLELGLAGLANARPAAKLSGDDGGGPEPSPLKPLPAKPQATPR